MSAPLWTKAEIAEAHRLAKACDANDAHWAFADWLAVKAPTRSRQTALTAVGRMAALAQELGWTEQALYSLRRTADAWPTVFRVPNASYSAHLRYREGGASAAPQRAERLAAAPLNRFGKVQTLKAPVDAPRTKWTSINVPLETHAAVVAEARATGLSIRDTAVQLVSEALGARAWLADEVAA